ncbi:MAG: hypothetical protein JSV25_01380 [Spirochaetota bacterium]|nr:MAG: hypothetical protein JSV25_01380 [Spirochaetota bacterium]
MKKYLLILSFFLLAGGVTEEILPTGKTEVPLGIRILPKGTLPEWTDKSMDEAYEKAKGGGFSISIYSHYWNNYEKTLGQYKWDAHENNLDYELLKIRKHRMTYFPIFEIIHTNMLGEYPEGISFTTFDDPGFVTAFIAFIKAFIDHVGNDAEYFIIGNEVDWYLHENPNLKDSFKNFYKTVVSEVHSINPDIKVGVIGAYHLARKTGEIELLRELGREGDFLVLTVYMEDDKAHPPVTQTEKYFNEMFKTYEGIKIGIVETGWSSGGKNGDYDKQVEFVKRYYRVLNENRDQIEFASWFILHDLSDDVNKMVASSFGIRGDNKWAKEFLNWQGSLGIIENDGTEKPAWKTWKEYMLGDIGGN